jgi:hypothetical protein
MSKNAKVTRIPPDLTPPEMSAKPNQFLASSMLEVGGLLGAQLREDLFLIGQYGVQDGLVL